MAAKDRIKHIVFELKEHSPFTILGALLGIAFMILFSKIGWQGGKTLFVIFHPAHVVLSAMVTTTLFRLHSVKQKIIIIILVGYFGSIGIATLSDILMPYMGSRIFGLNVPTEGEIHEMWEQQDAKADETDHTHEHEGIHLGFIEEWYIVNPAALFGILIGYFFPRSKFPHAGHILISTWASASYLMMQTGSGISAGSAASIFITLFISVWLPCCLSDIVFPLLFVKTDGGLSGQCPVCGKGGHIHV
jgi:hypothetical protein